MKKDTFTIKRQIGKNLPSQIGQSFTGDIYESIEELACNAHDADADNFWIKYDSEAGTLGSFAP